MKIAYFGSSSFAVPALDALLEKGYEVVCVVTQPDKKQGRGYHLAWTSVKKFALEKGLEIYQPDSINTVLSGQYLSAKNPDLFVVIAYGQILSQAILDIPKLYCLNLHASLLPAYRGAAPITRAIINGETTTGVSVIKMTQAMDAGPVMLAQSLKVRDEDTVLSLTIALSGIAAGLLIKAFVLIAEGKASFTEQDPGKITYAKKIKKTEGIINWDKPAGEILNLIRGCMSWPGAVTFYKGKAVKIHKASLRKGLGEAIPVEAGQILNVGPGVITVGTREGLLDIDEIQAEGGRIMPVNEFLRGHRMQAGDKFASHR